MNNKEYEHIESELLCNTTKAMRISSIEFYNFRNIEYGVLNFPNSDFKSLYTQTSSVLGIYGQNGSGKSSVIMALQILKTLLSGNSLSDKFNSCIRYGANKASLAFNMIAVTSTNYWDDFMTDEEESEEYGIEEFTEIRYSFDIIRNLESLSQKITMAVENEKIAISAHTTGGKLILPKQVLIDTSEQACGKSGLPFGNKKKFNMFVGKRSELILLLNEYKEKAHNESKSFIFCEDVLPLLVNEKQIESLLMLKPIMKQIDEELDKDITEYDDEKVDKLFVDFYNAYYDIIGIDKHTSIESSDDIDLDDMKKMLSEYEDQIPLKLAFMGVIYKLIDYGYNYLHIIDTLSTGRINLNFDLPLFHLKKYKGSHFIEQSNTYYVKMKEPSIIKEVYYSNVEHLANSLNLVLCKIVPGLTIGIQRLENRIDADGNTCIKFELLAERGEVVIPLKYESDGVRRIVSMLSLMIAAYNDESITLAVDEIDSGIFEYLLGEVISVMNETGKGQMIFTSHNLRPLEVLPAKSICFTTTNPLCRFTTLPRRGNSNLRDLYFRNIILGSAKDPLCTETSKYDIENAFMLAGYGDQDD